jgi:hypothetical protein
MSKKMLLLVGVLIAAAVLMTACAGPSGPEGPAGPAGPTGPAGPAGADGAPAMAADLTCTECHNDTSLITGKETAWSESVHGTGEAFVRGTSASCAGCHSGAGFSSMVAAGLTNVEVTEGDPNPTRQDCRTCHQIHTTYTGADWALETTDPVTLTISGMVFDGGEGNLCANCHQSREMAEAVDGMIEVDSTHWGPHHGPEADMLLGTTGYGVEGKPAAHSSMVENTCVTCHLGENANHSFEPAVASCTTCHADATNFDINGVQTEVETKLEELQANLVAAGLLTETGGIVVGSYPEGQAGALWNFLFITEDKSMGVHNASYVETMLEWSLAQFP